jgi:hypothetical protein
MLSGNGFSIDSTIVAGASEDGFREAIQFYREIGWKRGNYFYL